MDKNGSGRGSDVRRGKDPARVRQALLEQTAKIAADEGLGAATVAAVARAAGVTKGGLFHHFPNRQALVFAMFDELLERLDRRIDDDMARDPMEHGRFTRSYVNLALSMDEHDRLIWAGLMGSLVHDNALNGRWYGWLDKRLKRHASTDAGPVLQIVRLAVDGAWLAELGQTRFKNIKDLIQILTEFTVPKE
ncbi:TetR/AcrR family transcriptional regulator [Sphingomonas sp. IC081]|uniref:TetR/AcrR family transcriptional regulator n=1 Tax=Sphingomonas sp. IC081 TaxID=304378 RepID=UPI0021B0047A|nr:TetR/AcrR family transcriptional regulator [Sphingomonas sp. IC081]